MPKLSNTALTILNAAARRDDRVAELPSSLPAAARNAVARSLLKQWLVEQVDSGILHITNAGFRALDLEPPTEGATVLLGLPRRRAGRLAVAQPVRPLCVEPHHPVAHTVRRHVGQLRRVAATTAIVDNRQGHQLARLHCVRAAPLDPKTPTPWSPSEGRWRSVWRASECAPT
jgi:hypothetical protein